MHNSDNVIYLHPGRDIADGDLLPSLADLTEAVGAIGRCLAEIDSEPEAGASFGRVTTTPLLLHMTTVEQWLEKLAEIKVTTWPDVRWALHFCDTRVQALTYIRATTASLQAAQSYSEPPCAWEEHIAFADAGAIGRALRSVRDLIVERYPQTHRPAWE